jgi:hypothetical protein
LTRPAAVALALAAALACTTWPMAASTAGTRERAASSGLPPSTSACYSFALGALRQHVVVHHTPPVCAGLAPEDVNEAVARAIRTIVGSLPKAAARRQAVADSRYVGSLVRPVSPARPAPTIALAGPAASTVPARLAALTAWLMAAIAGAWLHARRLGLGRPRDRAPGVPPWIAGSHAGLATAGLALWIAFMVTGSALIGWLDVALTWLIAGLSMATLLADPSRSYASVGASAAAADTSTVVNLTPARGQAPVMTIALHGALAATMMALVLLAVLSVG